MQADEWIKLALVVLGPLLLAVVVTLWSIKQMMYRPKKRPATRSDEFEQVDAERLLPTTEDDASGRGESIDASRA